MRLDEMDIALERDVFLRSLIRELSGVLEMSSAKRSFGIFQRTGLGLPLVNQIVSAHRGTVVYFSEPGKGTTSRLSLPLR